MPRTESKRRNRSTGRVQRPGLVSFVCFTFFSSVTSVSFVSFVIGCLAGCGNASQPKGAALPYKPDPPARELKEAEIPLQEDLPRVQMKTSQGDLELVLFEDEAPNTVANFIALAEKKFYDGLTFHRILPDFCVQGGDPKGDGSGGPGYRFNDEFFETWHRNVYGTLAMANSGPDTNGSQFFFNVKKGAEGNQALDHKHVVFGKVVKGQEVLDKLAAVKTTGPKKRPADPDGKPLEEQKILSVSVLRKRGHAYEVRGKITEPAPGALAGRGFGRGQDPLKNLMNEKDPLKRLRELMSKEDFDKATQKMNEDIKQNQGAVPEKSTPLPAAKTPDAPAEKTPAKEPEKTP